jgi:hypothetical protein
VGNKFAVRFYWFTKIDSFVHTVFIYVGSLLPQMLNATLSDIALLQIFVGKISFICIYFAFFKLPLLKRVRL